MTIALRLFRVVRRFLIAPLGLPTIILSITVLIPAAVFLVTVWLSGWQLQVVRSGSMEPTYRTGTLLVTQPVVAADVRPGDALMFTAPWRNRRMVTHRVDRILTADDGTRRFVTRGDANDADDPAPVPSREVRGVVKWGVPKLGTAMWTLRGWRGIVVLIGLPTLALVVTESLERIRSRRVRCTSCHAPVRIGRTQATVTS